MNHHLSRCPVLTLIALVMLLAPLTLLSCGGDESSITVITEEPAGTVATTAASGATTATTATVEPTGAVAIPFTAGPYSGGTEEVMVLSDIRFGDQDGYERAVIEFTGQTANPVDSLPRYTVTRGAPPYYDANGNEIPLAGDAYIEIRANGNKADLSVDPYIEVYAGPDYFTPGLDLINSATMVPAYENNTVILLLDLADACPFRVIELSTPPRLVIDIEG